MNTISKLELEHTIKLAVKEVLPNVLKNLEQYSTYTGHGTCLRELLTALALNIYEHISPDDKTEDELVCVLSHRLEMEADRFFHN